jgi:hypothetical protein
MRQKILGFGGAIGIPLVRELKNYTNDIRLISRNPKKVNETDAWTVCSRHEGISGDVVPV